MREPVLLALIHIFAILSNMNPGGITARGRRILKGYFRRYLNPELEEEYFKLFEETLEFYSRELSSIGTDELTGKSSIISFQITNICRQIRKGLFLDERMIVFIQLLEFVYEDEKLTKQEKRIIEIVAKTFNISEEEYRNSVAFMFGKHLDDVSPKNMMLIEGSEREETDSGQYSTRDKWHSLNIEGLKGSIYVLHIESINALIFNYNGSQTLYFRGRTIVPGRPYLLDPGVSIKGRAISPIYYSGIIRIFFRNNYSERLVFEGHGIEYTFKNSDKGVKEMNFRADSGNFIGIMGGSGVGKSTLLDLMNGKLTPDKGEIFLNGYNIHTESENINGLIGYVPQDDLLLEELTVYQNLYYNAKLCFGNYSNNDIRVLVRKVLKDLELNDISDLTVGDPLNKKISGGQRKRLNIGLELIREPPIMFVDEPTSGLSSHDSRKVMELLKNQTEKGRLVFGIIHQPSSDILKLFDRLWILDQGGYMVYDGDPVDSLVYFKTETSVANAAESECLSCGNVRTDDILQLIATREIAGDGSEGKHRQVEPLDWYERYSKSMKPVVVSKPARIELPVSNFKVPERLSQLKTFLIRNILRKISDKQYLIINLIESPLLAFILAYLTRYSSNGEYIFADNKNLPVFLFMAIVVALFMGLTVSAEEIFKDKQILERQKYLDTSRISYLGSKILFLLALSAIQTLLFVVVSNLILGINGMLFRYWLILFSVAVSGNMIGLNISAGMKSVISIYILIPLILVPQLLLGGAMINFDDLHRSITKKVFVPVVGDLMTTRWAYEAITVEQFRNNHYQKLFFDYDMAISQNDWYASFLIPLLNRKARESELAINKEEYRDHSENNLKKLRKYIGILSEKAEIDNSGLLASLYFEEYDLNTVARTLKGLDSLKTHFRQKSLRFVGIKDTLMMQIESEYGRDYTIRLKQENKNNYLSDILLNRTGLEKIYENSTGIHQKADPVFMEPESSAGRSHFYAPYKMVGKLKINTFLFNLLVIWIMTIFLFITLYCNTLKWILDFFESLSITFKRE